MTTRDNLFVLSITCTCCRRKPFRQFSDSSTCSCTCPDDNVSLTYKCTDIGGFATIWTGSVISKLCEDSGHEILLLHCHFELDIYLNKSITCGNGTIVGQSVRVENSFTSQLTVTVSSDILGDTVSCAHSYNGTAYVSTTCTIKSQTG